jgi:hypothetical protein
MRYECSYDSDLDIVQAVTSGEASLQELTDMNHNIAEVCTREKTANILVDHSRLDARLLSMSDVRDLSSTTVSEKDIFQKRKCAHVVSEDLQYGLVRAWQIMVEVNGFNNLDLMVFKNRDDAIEWITGGS